jgi:nicotinamidase-related amidase
VNESQSSPELEDLGGLPSIRAGDIMLQFPDPTALLIIDVQQGFQDPRLGQRNNPQAESQIARLLATWRRANQPIFHVQHLSQEPNSPFRPGQSGCEFQAIALPHPDEPIIQKSVNSAFIGTDLETQLRQRQIEAIVIIGFTTNHCVSTTTRMAGNLGFETYVVADATAAFDRIGYDGQSYSADEIHAISLANLHQEFATVIDTELILKAFQ